MLINFIRTIIHVENNFKQMKKILKSLHLESKLIYYQMFFMKRVKWQVNHRGIDILRCICYKVVTKNFKERRILYFSTVLSTKNFQK